MLRRHRTTFATAAALSLLTAVAAAATLSAETSSPWTQAAAFECPAPGSLTSGPTGAPTGPLSGALTHVRFLADDALEGREVGTAGARCAGDYIASQLRALGLEGAGPDGSFFQGFPVRGGTVLGTRNLLEVEGRSHTPGQAWVPFGFSGTHSVDRPMLYGGSGVNQPGEPNGYARLDLTDKVVVVEGGSPSGVSSLYGDPHFKASVAAGRHAAAMIVLTDGGSLPDLAGEVRPSVDIPVIAVTGRLAERIRNASQEGLAARVQVDVAPRMVEARNVVAILPGTDPVLRHEVVIIGAHYDHLGFGGASSLSPDRRAIHNGADDNASGTATMLEVARQLVSDPPARSVLFMAFTGEERGLWGSGHYVNNPLLPIDRTVAMINMDMVGRLSNNRLTVFGVGTAEEWPSLLAGANGRLATPFELAENPDGYGPSDHSSFYGKGIPVLHFFTNTHADYHRPSDDWNLINGEGLERVVELVTEVARDVAGDGPDAVRITAISVEPPNPHGDAPPSSTDAPQRGYGAYFGSIPDMSGVAESGVRLTGVRQDSPADKAGLREGDVIVRFGGKDVGDLYEYTYALREHQAGDRVEVVVLRDGERVTMTAVLGERP